MKKAIVLAAGKGSRMKSDSFKVLHEVGGRPMISGLLDTLSNQGFEQVVVVLAPDMTAVEKVVHPYEIAIQDKPLGTAHAVLAAENKIGTFEGACYILFGDQPLYTADTFERMQAEYEKGRDIVVVGFEPDDPARYGRLIVDENGLEAIVEFKDATWEQRAIGLCNSGIMCVNGTKLFTLLKQIRNENAAQEYYLTDIIKLAKEAEMNVGYIVVNQKEASGVNSRIDLAIAEKIFQERMRQKVLANGVTLLDPETTYFSFDTQIENDVIIEPCVFIGPGVKIKKGARIPSFSRLCNQTVEGK